MQETGQVAVRCRGLTKTFGIGDARVTALRGVDLDIFQGELLMLVGPSGSGKTTLISIIAAILEPDAGQCSVFGHDLQQMGPIERAHFRGSTIGFVFQSFNLLPSLTAAENVSVPLVINGVPHRKAETCAMETVNLVGLGTRAHSLPAQLSGGQQQRVAIGRAIVHDPRLIVGDEPTSNLDHATGESIMETLRQMARRPDRAIIVVTHDPRIYKYADRIARMEDGKIIEIIADQNKAQLQ